MTHPTPETSLVDALKRVLGSTFCLHFNTQVAHWNVEGPLFLPLHDLFGQQIADMAAAIDALAERIRMIDAYAPATLERMQQLSAVPSLPAFVDARSLLLHLIAQHETVLTTLAPAFDVAEAQGHQGIADYLAERMTAHRQARWFLRASAKP